mmetsp:Transcript_74796/g.206225  ORF Transcript_74796/g.206225 Transcript_74796/m.206225 type:complete len:237 (+) Transcript_74796:1393-2103(+)
MRKRTPSSVLLSKVGAAPRRSRAASAPQGTGRARSWPRGAPTAGACTPPKATAGLHEGNRKPAPSGVKSGLKKYSFRFCLTDASSLRSSRSFVTCTTQVSGGTKSSQSSRLSHMCGLNSSLSKALSCSLKAEPCSEMFFQKALPMNSSPPQLPPVTWGDTSAAVPKSNLSRLRSTPLGTPGAAPGTSKVNSASPGRAAIKRWDRFGAREMDTLAVGTRPTATGTRRSWSMPISTPP